MGIKMSGGIATAMPALLPAQVCFIGISGAGSNRRPRRVHIQMQNANGQALEVRASLRFYLTDSSLARTSTITAALASGTAAFTAPVFQSTSRGGVQLVTAGVGGTLHSNTAGRLRLNITNASGTNVRRFLVVILPSGRRQISNVIDLDS